MRKTSKSCSLQLDLFQSEDFQSGEKADAPGAGQSVQTDLSPLFRRLQQSTFRSRFHLKAADKAYVQEKGMDTIRRHAADFVAKRLAPEVISNDGKQTPMRGHPVFLAQHATGCCCRGCLSKWHHIPQGRVLTPDEQRYVVDVLMAWIGKEMEGCSD